MRTSPKHRWSVSHNYLAGITAGDWLRLLRENRWRVDPVYYHRAALISLLSLPNSWNRRRESRRFDERIAATRIDEAPVFILGHWRSGTTHLHNLMAQDAAGFAYANTYQVVNPYTFLTTEEANTRRFAWLLPKKRPMDNMALTFQAPQEDEFAPLLMCLRSAYLGVTFPKHEDDYAAFLTFREASAEDREAWKRSFEWFLRKLTFKYGKRLLLKSPAHTGRIRLLLELFPDAKFVHIHRAPEEVYQSFRHYHDTATWYTYLQEPPDPQETDRRIIRRYAELFDAFFADKDSIPPGNFHEVSFADLESRPRETVAGIYDALGLPGFDRASGGIDAYLATLRGYEKNRFPPLDREERRRLREAWSPYYGKWGYEIRE